MEFLPYIFCGVTTIFACIFMFFRQKNSKFRTLGFKATAGVFFIMTALMANLNNSANPVYATLIICGGVFGVMGDVFLALKGIAPEHFKKLVAVGMLYFAFGHVFYFVAVLVSTEISLYSFLIGLIFVAIALIAFNTKRFERMGKMKIPCLVYYYVLSITLIQALFGMLASMQTFSIIFFVGTLFFFISDTLLSFMYFGGAKGKAVSIVNLSTYYVAQLLIALSILFI